MKPEILKAPFPWFGGKSRVAPQVWERFGDVDNYVEPFAGSLAVLLGRPTAPQTETVNDIDCYLANFWRGLALDPAAVAAACDWPVNEADLHARHRWLVNQDEFRERLKTDPDYFDCKIAGWWVWGISQWIGSGWCSLPEWTGRTNAGAAARGINGKRPMVHGGHTGKGVHAEEPGVASQFGSRKIPALSQDGQGRRLLHLGDAGKGTHAKRPNLGGRGPGNGIQGDDHFARLYSYFEALAARLRRVRVCCGDWTRVLGPSVTVKHGVCGVFLDPPYDMRVVSNRQSGRDGAARSDALYSTHSNDVSAEVRAWALENGDNPLLRIALCGYEGEHSMPTDWECVPWKASGGYGNQRRNYENAARERIWFSPYCLKGKQLDLFTGLAESPASAPAVPSRREAAESPQQRRAGRRKGGNPAPSAP